VTLGVTEPRHLVVISADISIDPAQYGRTSVPFTRFVPLVLVFTVGLALASSLGPNVAGSMIADLHFSPDSALADGTYTVLGEDGDGRMWLLACTPSSPVLSVTSSAVLSMAVRDYGPAPKIPTLRESLDTGVWVAGFVQRCP
jgi:hypothetical protein